MKADPMAEVMAGLSVGKMAHRKGGMTVGSKVD
jgi:hypothetical protein